jgi:NitT/TauT family transport system ATP-binding protein
MVAAALSTIHHVESGTALEVRDVSHEFDLDGKALQVLDRIHFRVKPGELVALLGPSGCGKSTLLRLVVARSPYEWSHHVKIGHDFGVTDDDGLEAPTLGTLLADGRGITGPHPSRVVMFQDPTLYPWRTVRANVSLGLETRGLLRMRCGRVDEALRLVGLTGFTTAYPHQLSGGMAQRVSLARALVNDPTLLLLDEPLGKLDSMTRITMQGELVSLWRRTGFSALLVTHDVEEALFMANRVIVLSDRPAAIKADVEVDLPYPRHRGDPRLVELRQQVVGLLGIDASW